MAKVRHSAITSNFKRHSITNLRVLTIFYDCRVCGFSCDCSSNCETARVIVETMHYFNRERGIPDLSKVSFRVAVNLHFTLTINCGTHTVFRDSSFSQPLALPTAELFIKDGAGSRIIPDYGQRGNVETSSSNTNKAQLLAHVDKTVQTAQKITTTSNR